MFKKYYVIKIDRQTQKAIHAGVIKAKNINEAKKQAFQDFRADILNLRAVVTVVSETRFIEACKAGAISNINL